MVYYCSTSDVGGRLGLNSAQRVQAGSLLISAIRRASIEIEQVYNDYGRANPTVLQTTSNGAVAVGDTSITLVSSTGFATTGSGNIDGEFSHVIREICADLAASYYMEDESTFQTSGPDGSMRGGMLRERGSLNLKRVAHLGSFS